MNTESNSLHPAVVLLFIDSEHNPPVACNSLIRGVVEIGLCRYVSKSVFDFPSLYQPEVILCEHLITTHIYIKC